MCCRRPAPIPRAMSAGCARSERGNGSKSCCRATSRPTSSPRCARAIHRGRARAPPFRSRPSPPSAASRPRRRWPKRSRRPASRIRPPAWRIPTRISCGTREKSSPAARPV
jgi:hypothetical protein